MQPLQLEGRPSSSSAAAASDTSSLTLSDDYEPELQATACGRPLCRCEQQAVHQTTKQIHKCHKIENNNFIKLKEKVTFRSGTAPAVLPQLNLHKTARPHAEGLNRMLQQIASRGQQIVTVQQSPDNHKPYR